jgi:hypothetical protein
MEAEAHLIVAPLSDAGLIEDRPIEERSWPSAELRGAHVPDLAVLHCAIEGHDPNEPLTPPQWTENLFTKQKVAVTIFDRYLDGFELVDEGRLLPGSTVGTMAADGLIQGRTLVFRVPPALVDSLARGRLPYRETRVEPPLDLARRWSTVSSSQRYADGKAMPGLSEEVAARCLDKLIEMAKLAVDRTDDLFVWEPE